MKRSLTSQNMRKKLMAPSIKEKNHSNMEGSKLLPLQPQKIFIASLSHLINAIDEKLCRICQPRMAKIGKLGVNFGALVKLN